MNQQRKAEIRRIAYDWAARELDARADNWDLPERLFTDDDERDEFSDQILTIIASLRAKSRGASAGRRPRAGP